MPPRPPQRRLGRTILALLLTAVTTSVAGLVLGASPALASAPEQWGENQSIPFVHGLVVLLLVPLGLFVLITLLVYVPSMARGESYHPGLAWRNEPEWFGGPRGGVETSERGQLETGAGRQPATAEEQEQNVRGGASARW